MSACPTGCCRPVTFGHLMCSSCWSQVPSDLKRAVVDAWARHGRLLRGPRAERTLERVAESRAAYESVKEAAIASIP